MSEIHIGRRDSVTLASANASEAAMGAADFLHLAAAPIFAIIASEFFSTGRFEISVFHGLSTGKICIAETTASASGVLNKIGCVTGGLFAALVLFASIVAAAQAPEAPGKPLPPGPMEPKVKASCTQCHNTSRLWD